MKERRLEDFRPFTMARFKPLRSGGFAVSCGFNGCPGYFGRARPKYPTAYNRDGEIVRGEKKWLHFQFEPDFSERQCEDGTYYAISKRATLRSAHSKRRSKAEVVGVAAIDVSPDVSSSLPEEKERNFYESVKKGMGWDRRPDQDISFQIAQDIAETKKSDCQEYRIERILTFNYPDCAICPRCGRMAIIKAFTEQSP
jgi:hypothetical protein